jgi:hypothetical protein
MSMRLYLDTEWANDAARELVSLALISDDARTQVYVERDPLPLAPSTFVREVVYPLLDRGDVAMPDEALTAQLRSAIEAADNPRVIADSPADFALLTAALGGFGRRGLPPAPPWRPTLDRSMAVALRIEEYFDTCPPAAARRHHAMVDAKALRWAVEGTLPPTRDAAALRDRVTVRQAKGQDYVLQADLRIADADAFWAFTGATSCFSVDGRTAIPLAAWSEYLDWLSEDKSADPSTITSSTKFEWRRRRGRLL